MLKEGKPVGKDPVLELLGRVSALCNDAELRSEDGVWKVEGDPTEGALYPFAAKLGIDRRRNRRPIPASTSSRSNPNTGSWRRSIARLRAASSCWSRARRGHPRPLRPARGAGGKRPPLDRAHLERPPTASPRKASGFWRWRGCPILASRQGASARPICRRPSCSSDLSGLSTRRARKRSRRSRNAMLVASG